jgi:thiol:disulfide interchange protein
MEDVVRQSMKPYGVGVLIVAVLVVTGCGGSDDVAPPPDMAPVVTSHDSVEITWEKDWDAAFTRARTEGKPVLVNFYAEWCVWCKHLESVTFRDSKVAGVLAGRVVPLSVDIDRVDTDLLRQHRVEAPPTIVLLSGEGQELGRIPGYMPPTGFLRAIESFIGPEQPVAG